MHVFFISVIYLAVAADFGFSKNVEIGWHLDRGLMRVVGVECGVYCCEGGAEGAFHRWLTAGLEGGCTPLSSALSNIGV